MGQRKLTPEDVRWGYRLLLEREPENLEIIKASIIAFEYVKPFIDSILSSEEYRSKNI